jgi:maleamate amidohydrolase
VPEGFGQPLGTPRRAAVLVVDLSVGFTDPSSPVGGDLDDVVAATRRVLDAARARGLPVVFTTVVFDAAGERAAAVFLRKVPALGVLRPGTRWIEIDPRLGRRDGEAVVVKALASGFFGTPLDALLRTEGCDGVVVCGATTSGCVRATVVDALQHGFIPIVPRECVGDRSPRSHEATLDDLASRYADVVGVDDVLQTLDAPAVGAGAHTEG